jgi:hypothetical protein
MIAMIRVLAVVLALPAAWGAFALWYQVPGPKPLKILALALYCLQMTGNGLMMSPR